MLYNVYIYTRIPTCICIQNIRETIYPLVTTNSLQNRPPLFQFIGHCSHGFPGSLYSGATVRPWCPSAC